MCIYAVCIYAGHFHWLHQQLSYPSVSHPIQSKASHFSTNGTTQMVPCLLTDMTRSLSEAPVPGYLMVLVARRRGQNLLGLRGWWTVQRHIDVLCGLDQVQHHLRCGGPAQERCVRTVCSQKKTFDLHSAFFSIHNNTQQHTQLRIHKIHCSTQIT